MNPELFTTSVQELFNKSIALAQQNRNPTLQPLHLLAVGLDNDFYTSFFKVLGLNSAELRALVDAELAKLPTVEGGQLTSDYQLEDFLKECQKEAEKLGDSYISLEHLFLQWCTTTYLPSAITTFFKHSES